MRANRQRRTNMNQIPHLVEFSQHQESVIVQEVEWRGEKKDRESSQHLNMKHKYLHACEIYLWMEKLHRLCSKSIYKEMWGGMKYIDAVKFLVCVHVNVLSRMYEENARRLTQTDDAAIWRASLFYVSSAATTIIFGSSKPFKKSFLGFCSSLSKTINYNQHESLYPQYPHAEMLSRRFLGSFHPLFRSVDVSVLTIVLPCWFLL